MTCLIGKNSMLHRLLDVSGVAPVTSNKRPANPKSYIEAFATQKVANKRSATKPAVELAAELGFEPLTSSEQLDSFDIELADDLLWPVDHADNNAIYKFVIRSKSLPEDMLEALCQAILLDKDQAIVCYLAQGEYRCIDNDRTVDSDTVLSWLVQEHEWRSKYLTTSSSSSSSSHTRAEDDDTECDDHNHPDHDHGHDQEVIIRHQVALDQRIGYTVTKNGPYPEDTLGTSRPFQIFLCSPNSTSSSNEDGGSLTVPSGLPAYRCWVHTPYTINLSRDSEPSGKVLLKQLLVCAKAGIRGCVVHVGKQLELDYETAYQTMKQQLIHTITALNKKVSNVNRRPYLLVETGAGQGTEICCHPLVLKTLITEVIEAVVEQTEPKGCSEEQVKLGICLDSCHVFAAGFCPLWSLQQLQPYVKLIHYNDSKRAFGSCVDRHALAGTGCIGYEVMTELWHRALELDIPCVVE